MNILHMRRVRSRLRDPGAFEIQVYDETPRFTAYLVDGDGPDGLAVVAGACMLAEATAAGVQACLPKQDGFGMALNYLQRVPGVLGAIVVEGERIGVAGAVEIAG
jgi:hypothetical protein